MKVFEHILKARKEKRKQFALLIDPDKTTVEQAQSLAIKCQMAKVDIILLGGSLLMQYHIDQLIEVIRLEYDCPIVLFPGSPLQLTAKADALLFLSLISGRNPDLLIGQHVTAAPIIKSLGLESIATAYMLIDGGKPTTASYISNTLPIPHNKPTIAACTAMAGELLGLQMLYMDTGSGAQSSVSPSMIKMVRKSIDIPLIIGGGIRDAETAHTICQAGADLIVVGTAIEENDALLMEMVQAVHSATEKIKG